MSVVILGIESSCDDTSASVFRDEVVLSNCVANQDVHQAYGGVVPELASRAHQQNIIPVVEKAIRDAKVSKDEIDAVAFTRGPGLMGSLLVGTSFAKGFALANNLPLIEVNHLHAHVLAHFIKEDKDDNNQPKFPFLCLLVSGGNSQIVHVKSHLDMEIIGQTIDDAAGEAFDKCAKVMGLPYPGGPLIDKLAKEGNPDAFQFSKPRIADFNYSFSGLKTSFLYFLRDQLKVNANFIEENKADICASLQKTIIDILMDKLIKASKATNIKQITLAGGVSANSGLRNRVEELAKSNNWVTYVPKFSYTTDNAAMIAINGYYKYLKKEFVKQDIAPFARLEF
ncbi:tRNA (adenosine(37)-N6)-threonylcarbamoyltransferase complex transferase subunit TsaD [Carboxylicivirga sp. N1Y90]|uniref:tRNA (adenosine(37)-N6)-threonylcarbamoyltransferase complex transferase subunit TsaD n=1 Tax=Carboxylicivirga fragile TaxID=3417571 RepID=UPI003D332D8F|nr:tRNA (adenosine(37)-N6)-threonylcarbamoyltransferase complex transferase subunit TsaD [Marinilabiliaceae bacterium N1Y90]